MRPTRRGTRVLRSHGGLMAEFAQAGVPHHRQSHRLVARADRSQPRFRDLLRDEQRAIVAAFAGFGGQKGESRFEGTSWTVLSTGGPVLVDALATVDCRVT